MKKVYGSDSSEIPSRFNKELCRTASQSKSAQVVLRQIDVENYCWRGQRVLPFHHSDTRHITHAGDFNWALLIKGWRRHPDCECLDGFLALVQIWHGLIPELMLEMGSATGEWAKPDILVVDYVHVKKVKNFEVVNLKVGEGSPAAERILTSVLNNEAQASADTENTPQTPLWWWGNV